MTRSIKTTLSDPDELLQSGNLSWRPGFEVEVLNANDSIRSATLVAVYDETLRRYACTSISVNPPGQGGELTGATLRDIRIAETLQSAALEHIWVEAAVVSGKPSMTYTFNGIAHYSAADTLRVLPAVSGRTTDDDVRNAVLAYAIAEVSGVPVLRTIGEALNTSQSTAKRLVARGRELGYIDG